VRAHNPATGLAAVAVAPADKATAAQRAGRAGRERAGHCFRLCTPEDFARLLPERAVPEAQRSDLSSLVLRLKALGVDDVAGFAWPAPPPPEALVRALETLRALGALGEEAELTIPLGARMAALLPLPPMVSRFLLAACEQGQGAEEAVVVTALLAAGSGGGGGGGDGGGGAGGASELTGGGVWSAPSSSSPSSAAYQRELERRVRLFGAAEGDLVALLNAFLAWKGRGGGFGGGGGSGDDAVARQRRQRAAAWASKRGLNVGALVAADRTAAALRRAVRRMGFFGRSNGGGNGNGADDGRAPLPSAEGDVDPLLRAVASGFFMNAAVYERTEYVDPLLDAVHGKGGQSQQQQGQRRGGGEGGGGGGSGGGGPREVHVYRLLRDPLRGVAGASGPRLRIHPSSVLARASPPPPCVVFCSAAQVSSGGVGGARARGGGQQQQQGDGVWADMSGVTAVEARWLAEAAPHVFRRRAVG
jgi:ATP-dependent RNA helicase DDX35